MNHIQSYLTKLRVRTFCLAGSVQDVKAIVREAADPCAASSQIFRDLIGYEKRFDDELYARTAVGYLIDELHHSNYEMEFDSTVFALRAIGRAQRLLDDPQWSFLQASVGEDILDGEGNVITPAKPVEVKVQVVEGIDTKVVVKENGKIKKGGKQPLANEMYIKNVVEGGMANKDFVKLLISELDMTQAGANTYAYNSRKAHEASVQ